MSERTPSLSIESTFSLNLFNQIHKLTNCNCKNWWKDREVALMAKQANKKKKTTRNERSLSYKMVKWFEMMIRGRLDTTEKNWFFFRNKMALYEGTNVQFPENIMDMPKMNSIHTLKGILFSYAELWSTKIEIMMCMRCCKSHKIEVLSFNILWRIL